MVTRAFKFVLLFTLMISTVFSNALAFEKHKYAALVVDQKTGKILFEENADKTRYPASITKVMTLYLAFEALKTGKIKMDQQVTVSRHAASMPKIKLGLRPGTKITIRDAIYASAIKSANDAAVVLAEAISGSEHEFAKLMNKRAKDLGMKHTHYLNASGLPNPAHKSSAYDIAKVAIAIERDYPEYYRIFQTKEYHIGNKTLKNTNKLLTTYNYQGVTGLKTGYIGLSGYNLVTTVKRGDRKLVAVVLGGPTGFARDRRMISLLDRFYGTRHTFPQAVLAKAKPKKQPNRSIAKANNPVKSVSSPKTTIDLANAKVSSKNVKAVQSKLASSKKSVNRKSRVASN